MFYKHIEPRKFDKLLGIEIVESDLVKFIVIPKPEELLNDMLKRNKK